MRWSRVAAALLALPGASGVGLCGPSAGDYSNFGVHSSVTNGKVHVGLAFSTAVSLDTRDVSVCCAFLDASEIITVLEKYPGEEDAVSAWLYKDCSGDAALLGGQSNEGKAGYFYTAVVSLEADFWPSAGNAPNGEVYCAVRDTRNKCYTAHVKSRAGVAPGALAEPSTIVDDDMFASDSELEDFVFASRRRQLDDAAIGSSDGFGDLSYDWSYSYSFSYDYSYSFSYGYSYSYDYGTSQSYDYSDGGSYSFSYGDGHSFSYGYSYSYDFDVSFSFIYSEECYGPNNYTSSIGDAEVSPTESADISWPVTAAGGTAGGPGVFYCMNLPSAWVANITTDSSDYASANDSISMFLYASYMSDGSAYGIWANVTLPTQAAASVGTDVAFNSSDWYESADYTGSDFPYSGTYTVYCALLLTDERCYNPHFSAEVTLGQRPLGRCDHFYAYSFSAYDISVLNRARPAEVTATFVYAASGLMTQEEAAGVTLYCDLLTADNMTAIAAEYATAVDPVAAFLFYNGTSKPWLSSTSTSSSSSSSSTIFANFTAFSTVFEYGLGDWPAADYTGGDFPYSGTYNLYCSVADVANNCYASALNNSIMLDSRAPVLCKSAFTLTPEAEYTYTPYMDYISSDFLLSDESFNKTFRYRNATVACQALSEGQVTTAKQQFSMYEDPLAAFLYFRPEDFTRVGVVDVASSDVSYYWSASGTSSSGSGGGTGANETDWYTASVTFPPFNWPSQDFEGIVWPYFWNFTTYCTLKDQSALDSVCFTPPITAQYSFGADLSQVLTVEMFSITPPSVDDNGDDLSFSFSFSFSFDWGSSTTWWNEEEEMEDTTTMSDGSSFRRRLGTSTSGGGTTTSSSSSGGGGGGNSSAPDGYTSEAGAAMRFSFWVNRTWSEDESLTLSVASTDASEGKVYVDTPDGLLSWSAGNSDAQWVYVTGQADDETDGDVSYNVTLQIVAYQGQVMATLGALSMTYLLENLDVDGYTYDVRKEADAIGLRYSLLETLLHGDESTAVAEFWLPSEPTGRVMFMPTSSNQRQAYVHYPQLLVFDPFNWDQPQLLYMMAPPNGWEQIPSSVYIDLFQTEDPRYRNAYSLTRVEIELTRYVTPAPTPAPTWAPTSMPTPMPTSMPTFAPTHAPDIPLELSLYTTNCDSGLAEAGGTCVLTVSVCGATLPTGLCDTASTLNLSSSWTGIGFNISLSDASVFTFAGGVMEETFEDQFDPTAGGGSEYTFNVTLYAVPNDIVDGIKTANVSVAAAADSRWFGGWKGIDISGYSLPIPYIVSVDDDDAASVTFYHNMSRYCWHDITYEDNNQNCTTFVSIGAQPLPGQNVTVTVSLPDASPHLTVEGECGFGDTAAFEDGNGAYVASVSVVWDNTTWQENRTVVFQGCDYDTAIQPTKYTEYDVNVAVASGDPAFASLVTQTFVFATMDDDSGLLGVSTPYNLTTDENGDTFSFNVTLLNAGAPDGDVVISLAYLTETVEVGEVEAWVGYPDQNGTFLNVSVAVLVASSSSFETIDGTCTVGTTHYLSCDGVCTPSTSTVVTLLANGACDDDLNCPLYDYDNGACSSAVNTDPVYNTVLYSYWDRAQNLTVTGFDDDVIDGDIEYLIKIGPTNCTDFQYDNITSWLTAINYDNDIIVYTIDDGETTLTTDEGGSEIAISFSVKATELAYDKVVVTLTGYYTNETTFSESVVTFNCIADDLYVCKLQSDTVTITGVDDYYDDGDAYYTLHVVPVMFWTTGGSEYTINIFDYDIEGVNEDDDTAGIHIVQSSSSSSQTTYKVSRDTTDLALSTSAPSLSAWTPGDSVTYESDVTSTVSFTIVLLSEPLHSEVYVEITSEWMCDDDTGAHPNGGVCRHEAVVWSDSNTDGSVGFEWTQTSYSIDTVYYDELIYVGSKDTSNSSAILRLLFTADDWNVPQTITIHGMDDLVDDYDTDYEIAISINDTTESVYSDMNDLIMTFTNNDNDTAGVVFVSGVGPSTLICSEPYYGLTASFRFYVLTEPKSPILFLITNTKQTISQVSASVGAKNVIDWYQPTKITISAIDNSYADGTRHTEVALRILFSDDPDYGTAAINPDGMTGLYSSAFGDTISVLDDPTDTDPTICAAGEYGFYHSNDGCDYCPMGTYTETAGDKFHCQKCPRGTWGVVYGAICRDTCTNWAGNTVDPGCMPCPTGYYQDELGQTSCKLCPEGNYTCGPLAATQAYSTEVPDAGVYHMWTNLQEPVFSVSWGGLTADIQMDDQQFSAFMMGLLFVICMLLTLKVMLLQKYSHKNRIARKFWRKCKEFYKKIDKFRDSHISTYHKPGSGQVPGGVATAGAMTVLLLYVGFIVFMYVSRYNESVTQSLLPVDEELLQATSMQLSWDVVFAGFAGCAAAVNDTDRVYVTTSLTGLDYNDHTYTYACNENTTDLHVTLAMDQASTVSGSPALTIKAYATCDACTVTEETTTSGSSASIYSCENCAGASARYITWAVTTDPLYAGDNNTVVGVMTPSSNANVFQGEDGPEIEISLIQATYDNEIEHITNDGFRLQFSSQDVGSTGGFTTDLSLCEADGCYWNNETGWFDFSNLTDIVLLQSTYLTSNFITDSSYLSTATTSSVELSFAMPLATQQLSIVIKPKTTWVDVWGTLGGIAGSIFGIFVILMVYFERTQDPNDQVVVKVRELAKKLSPRNLASPRSGGGRSPRGFERSPSPGGGRGVSHAGSPASRTGSPLSVRVAAAGGAAVAAGAAGATASSGAVDSPGSGGYDDRRVTGVRMRRPSTLLLAANEDNHYGSGGSGSTPDRRGSGGGGGAGSTPDRRGSTGGGGGLGSAVSSPYENTRLLDKGAMTPGTPTITPTAAATAAAASLESELASPGSPSSVLSDSDYTPLTPPPRAPDSPSVDPESPLPPTPVDDTAFLPPPPPPAAT